MFTTTTNNNNNNNNTLREIELVSIAHRLMKSNCTTLRENTENEENNNKPVDAGKIGAIPTPAQFPQPPPPPPCHVHSNGNIKKIESTQVLVQSVF